MMRHEIIDRFLGEIGVAEKPGTTANSPRILEYFDATDYDWVKTDETAWCSAFVNWLAWSCGLERSGELNARSWLSVGHEVKVPERGDLVIFWREDPDSWKGHVGLWIRQEGSLIWTGGGNQKNKVGIDPYPADRVLGYRHLPRIA